MCQFINSNDVFANPDNKDYICYNEAFCTALSGYRYLQSIANSQYIPLKNEYILHTPTDIYCISKRSSTAFATQPNRLIAEFIKYNKIRNEAEKDAPSCFIP